MSTDSPTIRSILEKPVRPSAPIERPAESETDSDYSAYAQGRISRHPQLMLILRQANGSARAFAYSYLYGAESENPALGFTLDFTQHQVKVRGRNLQILFRYICQHRVAEIRVANHAQCFEIGSEEPLVERIEIK